MPGLYRRLNCQAIDVILDQAVSGLLESLTTVLGDTQLSLCAIMGRFWEAAGARVRPNQTPQSPAARRMGVFSRANDSFILTASVEGGLVSLCTG